MTTPWFSPKPRDGGKHLLFCFPHAGGTAAAFRHWPKRLADAVDVVPVQLPGRGARLREAPFNRLTEAAWAAAAAILPLTVRPFAFFGHSLGGLLAFETARALRGMGGPEPHHLFLSSRRGPRIADTEAPIAWLAEPAFVTEVQRRYQAIPPEVARERELMSLLMPMLRADFEMLETYEYVAEDPLRCGLTSVGGDSDPRATVTLRAPWRGETTGAFDLHTFPGGHFYFAGAAEEGVLSWLEGRLAVLPLAQMVGNSERVS